MSLKVRERWDIVVRSPEIKSSRVCLEMSGLKLIFNWKAQIISIKLLFKFAVASLILWTVKNKEVSSANNFVLRRKLSDKSLS